jgi:hypothetical protein
MIIAHFPHDLDTLKACSLTCRAWYIVVAPRIHHTVVLGRYEDLGTSRSGLKPLSKLHELNLIPLVKETRILRWGWAGGWFGPQAFSRDDLVYFSAFTNVQALKIQGLDIGRFLPNIKRYFEQFSTTLRSISLDDPTCSSPLHLTHFLSLFQNLDDIDIRGFYPSAGRTSNTGLAPFSTPGLRGRLTLYSFRWVDTWTELIKICGGLRFRHMILRNAGNCIPTLVGACAGTLETVRFYVTDISGQ